MKGIEGGLRRFQSNFLLPLARSIFVVVATACLFGIGIGLLALVVLQIESGLPPSQVSVPPPYEPGPRSVDVSVVASRLVPPTNLRLIVTIDPIERVLAGTDILGRFDANSPNALAVYPDDFDIVGGPDASLFVKAPSGYSRTGVTASPSLLQQINSALSDHKPIEHRIFKLTIVARDAFGNTSAPTDIAFTLNFGIEAVPDNSSVPTPQPNTTIRQQDATPLQQLAREIALIADPEKTPKFFDAYERALQEPRTCGTNENDLQFLTNYRVAFERVKPNLTRSNLGAFYAGVCEAWRNVIAAEARARTANDAARNDAIQKNATAQTESLIARAGIAVLRAGAIYYLGGAIAFFLMISMYLAFLSMENHLKALREDMEKFLRGESGSTGDI